MNLSVTLCSAFNTGIYFVSLLRQRVCAAFLTSKKTFNWFGYFFFKMNLFKLDTQIPSAEKQGSLSGESCVKNKGTTVLYAALQAHVCG